MLGCHVNEREVTLEVPLGRPALEVLRRDLQLTGVKEGCREGDCGACLILLGERHGGDVLYRPVNSCLLPAGDLAGKHAVTVEGLNGDGLNAVQQAIVDEGATQCGFCTPGFVVALAGYLLQGGEADEARAADAMAGNLCRCTGYASLRRAAARLCRRLREAGAGPPAGLARIRWLAEQGFLPSAFAAAAARFAASPATPDTLVPLPPPGALAVAGGTDLYVQRPEELEDAPVVLLAGRPEWRGIRREDGRIVIGGAVTMEELAHAPALRACWPDAEEGFRLVASLPIRHRATIAGNLVNASPIGDMTIILLALGAAVRLAGDGTRREVPLASFYRGYKQLDRRRGEWVEAVAFPVPPPGARFSFEKVSRREHLDIASVNSAALIEAADGRVVRARLSAGGVAPVPKLLENASSALAGRPLGPAAADAAAAAADAEIAPISDVRGSAAYKRLLLRQLLRAHFLKLFPDGVPEEAWA